MLNGCQIRAARALLRWSAQDLAKRAGVGIQTIKRFEAFDGLPPSRSSTLLDVQLALQAAGVEFTEDDGIQGPGVRFASSTKRGQP